MASGHGEKREMVLLLTGFLSYRALRGRRDDLGLMLRPDEAERLAELEAVFGVDSDVSQPILLPRLHERFPVRLPLEFRRADGLPCEGTLLNLSTHGFFVATSHTRTPGERLTFRFVDHGAGREWQFAGEVAQARGGDRSGMGLRFVGIPLEVHHTRPPTSGDRLSVAA